MTAYLVAHFRIVRGQPVFLGTCIYSEPGDSVTSAIGPNKWAVTVLEADAPTFHEAINALLEMRDSAHERCDRWAFDALKER